MRNLFILLTITLGARSFPVPVGESDLDLFYPDSASDSGLDLGWDLGSDSGLDFGLNSGLDSGLDSGLFSNSIGLDDSSQSFLLAGNDGWSVTPPGGDTSWTGKDRDGSKGDWPVKIPGWRPTPGSKRPAGGDSGTIINSDVNGPTNFELSPDQINTILTGGTVVVGGIVWGYNKATGAINSLGDILGPLVPSVGI